MARHICTIKGARGRTIELYDKKCVITTEVTVGSVLSSNATDGTKTIFFKDCVGIQFKRSGMTLGFLQFETPSMQMNNQNSNFFSENTFTFDKEGMNDIMTNIYEFACDVVESIKYGTEFPEQDMKYLVSYLMRNGIEVNQAL